MQKLQSVKEKKMVFCCGICKVALDRKINRFTNTSNFTEKTDKQQKKETLKASIAFVEVKCLNLKSFSSCMQNTLQLLVLRGATSSDESGLNSCQ